MAPVTLITGGSTGIGAETARLLLKQGHRVAVTARRAERLAEFAQSTGVAGDQLITLAGDTSDPEHVREAIDRTVAAWGRLDNVVVNAGFSLTGTLVDHTPEDMRSMVLTNVLGPALVVQAALPRLKETKGRLVLVGSVAGVRNTPGNLYSVTKWAVHALAENTRQLAAPAGVGVTLIAPGVVDTPFWEVRGLNPDAPTMTATQVADGIAFALNQPEGVAVNHLQMRPVGQVG